MFLSIFFLKKSVENDPVQTPPPKCGIFHTFFFFLTGSLTCFDSCDFHLHRQCPSKFFSGTKHSHHDSQSLLLLSLTLHRSWNSLYSSSSFFLYAICLIFLVSMPLCLCWPPRYNWPLSLSTTTLSSSPLTPDLLTHPASRLPIQATIPPSPLLPRWLFPPRIRLGGHTFIIVFFSTIIFFFLQN